MGMSTGKITWCLISVLLSSGCHTREVLPRDSHHTTCFLAYFSIVGPNQVILHPVIMKYSYPKKTAHVLPPSANCTVKQES